MKSVASLAQQGREPEKADFIMPTAEEIATLPAKTIERIHKYSAELPPSAARAALEEALRPRLRTTRPPKTVTPMRLFCWPFEDLLTDRNPRVRPTALIPRRVLMPFWTILTKPATVSDLLRGPSDEHPLPLVTAKGMDETAAQLRRFAQEASVPIIGNPPVARALYKVGVDEPIPEELFETVAAILRWVESIGSKTAKPPGAAPASALN